MADMTRTLRKGGDKTQFMLVALRDITPEEKATVLATLAKRDALDLAEMLGLTDADA